MRNIFENAYFGKVYRTRDGRKAYFRHYQHGDVRPYMCLIDGEEHWYRLNGKNYVWKEDDYDNPIDIVSEWEEEIDEEFEKYADFATDNFWSDDMETFDGNPLEKEIYYVCRRCYNAGLKAGYRKAKQEYF